MGYHSLLSISHDTFDENAPGQMEALRGVVSGGDAFAANHLEQVSKGAIKRVSIRHSTTRYIVSADTPGFPVELPYDEELDKEIQEFAAAETKAKAWLGGSIKLRTMAQVRDLVVKLMRKTKTVDAQISAQDGVFFANRRLADTNWRPSRSDYEALKNRLMKIDQLLSESA